MADYVVRILTPEEADAKYVAAEGGVVADSSLPERLSEENLSATFVRVDEDGHLVIDGEQIDVGDDTVAALAARMTTLGTADRQASLAKSNVAYADATSIHEPWANLTAWNVVGPLIVSSGAVISSATDGTDGIARYPLELAAGQDLLITGTLKSVPGTTGDNVAIRLSTKAHDATYTANDTFGIGITSDGQLFRYWGTGLGGTGVTIFGAGGSQVWSYVIYADAESVSVSFTSADGATTYRGRIDRSVMTAGGGIRALVVTQDDRRGAAGMLINGLSINKAAISPRPRAIFANTTRLIGNRTGSAQDTRIALPASFDSRVPAPVLISCHGNTQTQDHMVTGAQRIGLIKAFTDAGFIYASSLMGGNNWGSPAGVDSITALYRYLRDHFPIGPVVLLGESMGGLATANAIHRGALPLAGVGFADAVLNLGWQYANGVGGDLTPDATGIKAAYGIASDGSDYASKTAGFDPVLAPVENYRGVPIRFTASAADTRVPKAQHADVLYARLSAAFPATTSLVTHGGGHTADSAFYNSTWVDWIKGCVTA